ncbi:MAG TPA: hypothetical protein PK379_11825 [Candidatus Hydrogenedentes bacterium]|nr:hypothetical protein [Candidatus Hydrogenedentota bacterium]HOK90705.1 hypothetical protein [Candidatus Hydrogenedentota bacterium]
MTPPETGAASQDTPASPADAAKTERPDPETIRQALKMALDKDRLIRAMAAATRFGGATISIPGSLQAVPYNLIPEAEALRQKGVTVRLKTLTFRDLSIDGEDQYTWDQEKPVIPRTMRFSRLAVEAEAEYKNLKVPLAADFRDGLLPFDYLLHPAGFDVTVIPERAKDQFSLKDVKLKVGNGLTSAIANLLVSPKVGELLLRYGVGQTIKIAGDSSNSGGTDWFDTGKKVLDAFGISR